MNCITPTTTFCNPADSKDPRNGYRTELQLNVDHPLPNTSLISLESTACVCPDAFHLTTRTVEKDFKMIPKFLLEKNRIDNFKKLEANINTRHVKNSQFAYSFKG